MELDKLLFPKLFALLCQLLVLFSFHELSKNSLLLLSEYLLIIPLEGYIIEKTGVEIQYKKSNTSQFQM